MIGIVLLPALAAIAKLNSSPMVVELLLMRGSHVSISNNSQCSIDVPVNKEEHTHAATMKIMNRKTPVSHALNSLKKQMKDVKSLFRYGEEMVKAKHVKTVRNVKIDGTHSALLAS